MTKRRSKKKKSGSHGYGSQKKNRGAGNRGGRGNAGRGKKAKHEKMTEDGVHQLGESGFTSRSGEKDGINLREIDQRIESYVEEGVAEEKEDGYVFFASEAGYDKVLGGGELRKSIDVQADEFSGTAEEKIKDAGNEAIAEE